MYGCIYSNVGLYSSSSDGTFYTGVTTNLDRRLYQHNHTNGTKHYTSSRKPVRYVYTEEFPSHAPAYKRERQIKKLNHEEKLEIIEAEYAFSKIPLKETSLIEASH